MQLRPKLSDEEVKAEHDRRFGKPSRLQNYLIWLLTNPQAVVIMFKLILLFAPIVTLAITIAMGLAWGWLEPFPIIFGVMFIFAAINLWRNRLLIFKDKWDASSSMVVGGGATIDKLVYRGALSKRFGIEQPPTHEVKENIEEDDERHIDH